MRVIVVGCGKVGKTITDELVKEGHDIVLVDKNEELVELKETVKSPRKIFSSRKECYVPTWHTHTHALFRFCKCN